MSLFASLTTVFFGGIALFSIWPGAVEADVSAPFLAVLSIGWLTWAAVRTGQRGLRGEPFSWTGLGLLILALGAIWFDLPRRLAFAAGRSSFEAVALGQGAPERLPNPPADARFSSVPLPEGALGIYRVLDSLRDARGGVYFRTSTSSDMMIDTMSWGFAWRPNQEGSPYGRARYRLRPLGGAWYSFRASDDY